MSEYEIKMLELMTEIRDELFRQGEAHRTDGYGVSYVYTQEYN